ncbi:MAG: HAD family hydrolase [Deltaproteobacteria bacterium]|nr:HAD family hydrolase [Deltaproteobacteria bacterium]MBW2445032.1 HAD family hydrolase [Deltaproteobacteria bacterium]
MTDELPATRPNRVGAFFDMDKTLICENSGSLYMKYRYERGELTGWDLVKGLGAYLQYKAGVLDIADWTESMLSQFKGESEAEMEREAAVWFEECVAETVYPEAAEVVQGHLDAGHIVAIVSGSMRFVVQPLALRLGIPHVLYTRLEVEDGLFTGRVIEPICMEEGKIYWLQQFIEEERIDLAKSWFYTDSITDLPLLDLVGHPVVTNPDPFLYREAVRRRWPVKLFKSPMEPAA